MSRESARPARSRPINCPVTISISRDDGDGGAVVQQRPMSQSLQPEIGDFATQITGSSSWTDVHRSPTPSPDLSPTSPESQRRGAKQALRKWLGIPVSKRAAALSKGNSLPSPNSPGGSGSEAEEGGKLSPSPPRSPNSSPKGNKKGAKHKLQRWLSQSKSSNRSSSDSMVVGSTSPVDLAARPRAPLLRSGRFNDEEEDSVFTRGSPPISPGYLERAQILRALERCMSYDLDYDEDPFTSRARSGALASERFPSPFRRNPKGYDMKSTGESGFLSGVRVIDRKTFQEDRYHTGPRDDKVPEAGVVYRGLREIQAAFREYDKDGNGRISMQEAHKVLETKLGYSMSQTRQLLRMCDRNHDGHLTIDEFIEFFLRVREKARELRAIFHEFDRDHNGRISMAEAKTAFRNMAFKDEEIENLVRAYDANDDGFLQYEEFVKLWNA